MIENELTINGIQYIRKECIESKELIGENKYVLVRGDRSGVFAGYFVSRYGREVLLRNVRWIWYWDGAASLSQLAVDGTSKPESCKFPVEVSERLILDCIEILPVSEKARLSIASVPVWQR